MKQRLEVKFKPSPPWQKAITLPKLHRCPFCKARPVVCGNTNPEPDEQTFVTQAVGLLIFSSSSPARDVNYWVAVRCPKCHARGPAHPTALSASVAWNKAF